MTAPIAPATLGSQRRQTAGGVPAVPSRPSADAMAVAMPATAVDAEETTRDDAAASGQVCAAVARLVGQDRPAERLALQASLARRLDELFGARCRALVGSRLKAVPESVRAAVLAARSGQARAVEQLIAGLSPATAVRVLGTALAGDDRPLIEGLLDCTEPALREAALDWLYGWEGTRPLVIDGLDQQCLTVLRSGLAALGLDYARSSDGALAKPALSALAKPALSALAEPAPSAEAEPALEDGSSELALRNALQRGAARMAIRHLARAAAVDVALVEQVVQQRDPRSLVSLAWKAGYSMRAAVSLQTDLAGIPPALALGPLETGSCPLSRGEMAWQLREMMLSSKAAASDATKKQGQGVVLSTVA